MKRLLYIFAFLIALTPFFSFAQQNQPNSSEQVQDNKKQAIYFYADWCPHCNNVDDFFKENGFYDKYEIIKLDFDKKENKELLSKIFAKKFQAGAGIPALVIDNQLLAGDEPIIQNFVEEMDKSKGTAVAFVEEVGGKEITVKKDETIVPLPVLFGAALVDAINPCAFAVLIILMATVIAAGKKREALYAGLLFSLAIFISYLLMGLGFYKAITFFNASFYISLGVGIIAILVGLANIKDYFWYGKGFIMEVPRSWRDNMKKVIRKVTSPGGAFVAGLIVSLFLLPCTSGPYVVILGLLSQKVEVGRAFPLLLLYNLIFILPMIAITIAVSYFGSKARELEEMRKKNVRLLHGIAGVIMLGIGLYLLSGLL